MYCIIYRQTIWWHLLVNSSLANVVALGEFLEFIERAASGARVKAHCENAVDK